MSNLGKYQTKNKVAVQVNSGPGYRSGQLGNEIDRSGIGSLACRVLRLFVVVFRPIDR